MKILFLNPHVDAEHHWMKALSQRGDAILRPENAEEAWQMLQLHGASVDLAIVHREGVENRAAAPVQRPEPGIRLIAKIKGDPIQADLPIVLTSQDWNESDFHRHQTTPYGVNAYLQWPSSEGDLLNVIQQIFPPEPEAQPELVLEEASGVFARSEPEGRVSTGISLEGPSQGLSEAPSIPTALTIDAPQQPPPPSIENQALESPEHEVAQEMPYLFKDRRPVDPSQFLGVPIGDVIVPGGSVQTPDVETLKKYLLLREQDVAILSAQLKAVQEQFNLLEGTLREERALCVELNHLAQEQKQRIHDFEKEKQLAVNNALGEVDELRFQLKVKTDRTKILEAQARGASEEIEKLKERVRTDIRKIRVREKELENRLEILKKDSEALITARETKIIELKRKMDVLEFNMDLLQDQFVREKENSDQLRDRLAKAAQVMRVAGGLLETPAGKVDRSEVGVDPISSSSTGFEKEAS